VVWMPAMGIVHLSHRVPATGFPVVNEAAPGMTPEATVE